jgi:hypothetical protein
MGNYCNQVRVEFNDSKGWEKRLLWVQTKTKHAKIVAWERETVQEQRAKNKRSIYWILITPCRSPRTIESRKLVFSLASTLSPQTIRFKFSQSDPQ